MLWPSGLALIIGFLALAATHPLMAIGVAVLAWAIWRTC